MTSEYKSVEQVATLTTDAVPIPTTEVPNTDTQAVSGDNSAQNQSVENDSHDSEESEDPQDENAPRSDETGNVKPIEVIETRSEEELPSPKEPEDKMNKTMENPKDNNQKEKKKKPTSDKRIMKQNNSLLPGPGPAPSVVYSIKNVSGLQIGPNITINMASKQQKSPKMSTRRIPRDVEEMFRSTVPVTEEDLETVSSHVGRGWRQVGRRLNFTDGELDQFKADYTLDGRKEVIYQMLLAWKQAMTDKATRGILCSALWSADLCDAAEKLVRG
uniref:IMD-like protein n=1 Tax=Schistocerca gregaria TaxID=7010 RepID=I3V9Q3_SCHGR|nr:IMD-like protein [Schistocerca gregaria]